MDPRTAVGLRVFLRAGRDRAERDRAADLVQKARLDLSAVAIGFVLLASPALAQDGPLTTLMRPQPLSGPAPLGRGSPLAGQDRLFGDNPLASVDALTGEGSLSNQRPARPRPSAAAKPGEEATVACDPRTVVRRPPPGAAATGGSGPGDYARFVEGEGKTPAAAPRAAGSGEQPLYGGTDRPLWGDATKPRVAAAAKPGAARAPVPGVDRPLWADASAARDAASDRCDGETGTRRAGTAAPPTSTLFFGSGPAR